jgi:hypothetical protein
MFRQELQPEYLARPAAAAFICRSIAWLRREESLGRGPARTRLGKSPIYKIADLRRFMDERAEPAEGEQ